MTKKLHISCAMGNLITKESKQSMVFELQLKYKIQGRNQGTEVKQLKPTGHMPIW